MTLRLSRLLFLLSVATLPVAQLPVAAFAGYPVQVGDILMLGAIVAWTAAVVLKETRLKADRFSIFVALYGTVLAASIPGSENPYLSTVKFSGELYLFAIAFLTFQLMAGEESMLRKSALAWSAGVATTVIFSVVAVALFYTGYATQESNPLLSHFGSLPAGDYPRIRSVFANANMMANYLNIGIPIIAAAAARGWLTRPLQRTVAIGAWASAFLTLSPGFGGIVLSASIQRLRTTVSHPKLLLAVGIITASAFFGAALVSPDTKNTDAGIHFQGTTIEPSVRVLVWKSSLEAIARAPILGRGVGIDPATVRYEAVNGDLQSLRDAHNMFLNVAGQTGLLGLAALVALLIHLGLRLRRAARNDVFAYALWCAFLGGVLYQGLTGSFENARHVWVLFGMVAAMTPSDRRAADMTAVESQT